MAKHWVTVHLDERDFRRLNELCDERGQSKTDYIRAAIRVPEHVPIMSTRPNVKNKRLRGAPMRSHQAKLRREKRKAARR